MPRRNIRKKKTEEEELDQHDSSKPTSKRGSNPASLSFDLEEEPVLTVVKKSTKKPTREMKFTELLKTTSVSTQTSTPGSYTAEKLADLKKSTLSIQGLKTKEDPSQSTPSIRISGTFKPNKIPPPPPPATEAFIRVGQESKQEVQEEEAGFVPPNLQMIRLAKAKRERLREARLAPDYLPLGGASNLLSQDFKTTEDQRMASGSDSEDQEDNVRVQFLGVKKPQRPRELNEEDGVDLMEDEEGVDSFADVQSKKGVRSLGIADHQQTSNSQPIEARTEVCVLPVVNRFSIHESAENVLELIEQDIEKLKFDQEMSERNVSIAEQSLFQIQGEIQKTKTDIEDAGLRYKDIQEMKEYIADLCDCLKEKVPFVEELEEHLMELYSKEGMLFEQEDELCEQDKELADLASDVVHRVMANGGSTSLAVIQSQRAIEDKEAEFGSEGSIDNTRKRRWEAGQKLLEAGSYNLEDDPLWTDSVKDLEMEEHLSEMQETGNSLFSDTLPIFGDLHSIKIEFENWRRKRRKSYDLAYIPESLPAILAPFIRLEILTWSPFHGSELGLESQNWYSEVESYGLEADDDDLLPALVKQVLLPAVKQQLTKCWTPFHFHLTLIASELIREMLVYVQMEDPEMQKLLQLTQKKLAMAVGMNGVPPYPKITLMASEVVRNVVEIRFYRCLHLIGSIGCFHDVLPVSFLQKLLFEDLICTNMLPYLRGITTDPENALIKTLKMMELIPKPWINQSDRSREFLQIVDVMHALSRSMMKQRGELLKRDEGVGILNTRVSAFVDYLKILGSHQKASELQDMFL